MSATILFVSVSLAKLMLLVAVAAAALRMIRGPRAQDRIMGLDTLYINGMLLLVAFGIGSGRSIYFEAALVIALLGFESSEALSKILMRGEVVE